MMKSEARKSALTSSSATLDRVIASVSQRRQTSLGGMLSSANSRNPRPPTTGFSIT
jgi:hypothetical protein